MIPKTSKVKAEIQTLLDEETSIFRAKVMGEIEKMKERKSFNFSISYSGDLGSVVVKELEDAGYRVEITEDMADHDEILSVYID